MQITFNRCNICGTIDEHRHGMGQGGFQCKGCGSTNYLKRTEVGKFTGDIPLESILKNIKYSSDKEVVCYTEGCTAIRPCMICSTCERFKSKEAPNEFSN